MISVYANRVLHCSLVSKASLADSLIGPPPECLSSVHITHAQSARVVAVDVSRESATNTDVRHVTRIIGRPPRSFVNTSGSLVAIASRAATQYRPPRPLSVIQTPIVASMNRITTSPAAQDRS